MHESLESTCFKNTTGTDAASIDFVCAPKALPMLPTSRNTKARASTEMHEYVDDPCSEATIYHTTLRAPALFQQIIRATTALQIKSTTCFVLMSSIKTHQKNGRRKLPHKMLDVCNETRNKHENHICAFWRLPGCAPNVAHALVSA